ncbi:acetyltransferase [Buttiauxella izardii]|uniref:Acetyltransferase n=1 Tax=Buttiauxella izardii TaxID=82991 RepID=A0A3A5JND4_9ENTR|nr:acetyltransferase [Buttiauxella izardii]RJT20983.1 acetyltransferase [Buttiauxella izardii]
MKLYGIAGAGGFGREVIPIVKQMINDLPHGHSTEVVFILETSETSEINGYKVLSQQEFINSSHDEKFFNVAIADSKIRERIANLLIEAGAVPFTVTHQNTVIYTESEIHPSAILCPFVTVTANAKIGKFFHANVHSYIAHDCVIGDYVTFAPGVRCNGSVTIEDHAYIGAGAVIKQGTANRPVVIGAGAVVGMGAVVTKSVPPGITVMGNPAKPKAIIE